MLASDLDPVRLALADLRGAGVLESDPVVGGEGKGVVEVVSTKLCVPTRGGELETAPGPELVSCDNPTLERFLSAASNKSSQPFIVSIADSCALAILGCLALSRIVRSEQWNPSVR